MPSSVRRTALKQLFILVPILLLAAVVRILNIDGPALWTDEGFTYYTFKIGLFDALLSDRHPPFYFYTLHAWVEVVGDSILAMRYWSFLPSMLSIAVMFQLGRELVQHRPQLIGRGGLLGVPVMAALLMTLTDGENYLAQELRMYTWHVLFAALSTLFYLKFVRTSRRRWALWWIFSSTLLIHTHYFGGMVMLVQGFHTLLFLRGRQRIEAVGAFAAMGLLFAPWFFSVTLQQFGADNVCVNCPPPDNWSRLLEFREFWFGAHWPLTIGLFLLGLVTVRCSVRKVSVTAKPVHLIFLLVMLIITPIVVIYRLGHTEVIFFAHRLTQITVPIVALLALGLGNLPTRARGVLAAALLLYGVTTVDWYRIKVPWHTVTEMVAEYAVADELVLGEVGPEESALLYYFDHILPEGTQTTTYPFWGDIDPYVYYEVETPALLARQPERQDGDVTTAWLVYFSKDTAFMRHLADADYVRTMTQVYDHVDDAQIQIFRYDLLPQTPITTFENGMTLHAAEIRYAELRVDLWWSADTTLERDYVVSAFLLDESGTLVTQLDTQPVNNTRPTTSWQTGDVIYDPHVMQMLDGIEALPPGTYTFGVKVYAFAPDGTIETFLTGEGEDFVTVGAYTIR